MESDNNINNNNNNVRVTSQRTVRNATQQRNATQHNQKTTIFRVVNDKFRYFLAHREEGYREVRQNKIEDARGHIHVAVKCKYTIAASDWLSELANVGRSIYGHARGC